jgi:hypothetical protein
MFDLSRMCDRNDRDDRTAAACGVLSKRCHFWACCKQCIVTVHSAYIVGYVL